MPRQWNPDSILGLARAYQPTCTLAAAVDLDVFTLLATTELTASEAAARLNTDPRGTAVLLNALVALELLEKHDQRYRVPAGVVETLTETGARSVLPMARHQANCLRRWAQLTAVVQSGRPAERIPSIRGEAADQAAFIGAMHCVSAPVAEQLVARIQPLSFEHLLDVGGASGTWTIAFLRAVSGATATLFDLPDAIPLAERRLADAGLSDRVELVGGDFYTDALPGGADFAWVSAIVHQAAREQNRELFRNVYQALSPGGVIVVRDVVMDESRTGPAAGATFAVNMLVATQGGGTYTFDDLRADLELAGFTDVKLTCRDEFMNSLLRAAKPR